MIIRAHELLRVLQQVPAHTEVTTWDGGTSEDIAVETALYVRDGVSGPVLVLGQCLPKDLLRQGQVLWSCAPAAELVSASERNEAENQGEEREAS